MNGQRSSDPHREGREGVSCAQYALKRAYKRILKPALAVAIIVFSLASWSGDFLLAANLAAFMGMLTGIYFSIESMVPAGFCQKAEKIGDKIALPVVGSILSVAAIGGLLSWLVPTRWAIGIGIVMVVVAILFAANSFQKAMRKADEDL